MNLCICSTEYMKGRYFIGLKGKEFRAGGFFYTLLCLGSHWKSVESCRPLLRLVFHPSNVLNSEKLSEQYSDYWQIPHLSSPIVNVFPYFILSLFVCACAFFSQNILRFNYRYCTSPQNLFSMYLLQTNVFCCIISLKGSHSGNLTLKQYCYYISHIFYDSVYMKYPGQVNPWGQNTDLWLPVAEGRE